MLGDVINFIIEGIKHILNVLYSGPALIDLFRCEDFARMYKLFSVRFMDRSGRDSALYAARGRDLSWVYGQHTGVIF